MSSNLFDSNVNRPHKAPREEVMRANQVAAVAGRRS